MKAGINFEPTVLMFIDSYSRLHCNGNRSKAVNDLLKKDLKIQQEPPLCPNHKIPMIKRKRAFYCPKFDCIETAPLR